METMNSSYRSIGERREGFGMVVEHISCIGRRWVCKDPTDLLIVYVSWMPISAVLINHSYSQASLLTIVATSASLISSNTEQSRFYTPLRDWDTARLAALTKQWMQYIVTPLSLGKDGVGNSTNSEYLHQLSPGASPCGLICRSLPFVDSPHFWVPMP